MHSPALTRPRHAAPPIDAVRAYRERIERAAFCNISVTGLYDMEDEPYGCEAEAFEQVADYNDRGGYTRSKTLAYVQAGNATAALDALAEKLGVSRTLASMEGV